MSVAPRIEHLGDVRMIHHRQRLALGFEAGDDLLGVHAQLDDLERDAAAHRFLLLGHVDHAAAAFADFLEQFVAADAVAQCHRFSDRRCGGGEVAGHQPATERGWAFQRNCPRPRRASSPSAPAEQGRRRKPARDRPRVWPGRAVRRRVEDRFLARDAIRRCRCIHSLYLKKRIFRPPADTVPQIFLEAAVWLPQPSLNSASSQALAKRQALSTVRSEMPSISAISRFSKPTKKRSLTISALAAS